MQPASQEAHGAEISCARAPEDCQGSPPKDQNRARLLPIHRGSIMSSMGFSETIFLFFLALLIFGPKKLPEIARQVGKALNEFKRASNEFKAQIASEIAQLEVENQRQTLPPAKEPEGTMATLPPASPEVSHPPAPVPELVTEPNAATKAGPDA
jgi:TatA/E family protein of Tat protein translocase